MLFKKFFMPALFGLLLGACSSSPTSYLPNGTQPIVNIEANINSLINVEASSNALTVVNKTARPLSLLYTLIWYDKDGVTQTTNGAENPPWHTLQLEAEQKSALQLDKPSAESENYRIYLRSSR
ncbi:YcfL family protein [Glaesserella sp.]|uniref:YcfL family protein n=1 Tax=Glaesserella sp. TaxID=2094731 RepID=UPI0035A07D55